MPPFIDTVANLGDLLDPARPLNAIAVIDCLDWERPREYSYGELHRLANHCARGLLARGLRRGDAVAILAGNRVEFLIAYLGTMRAGLVSVPVNHKFPRETIEFVMRDSGVKLVFADGERRTQVPPGLPAVDFDSEGSDGFRALLDPGELMHAARASGFAPDGTQVVIRGLCAPCRAG